MVVDADLHLSKLHKIFGLELGGGLPAALEHPNPSSYLQDTKINGLRFLSGGDLPSDPAAVFNSPQFSDLIDVLANEADLLLIDSPPVLSVADTTTLASKADGVLFVIRAGQTRSQTAREGFQSLRKIGVKTIMVVLNDVIERRDGYYSYYSKKSKVATLQSNSKIEPSISMLPMSNILISEQGPGETKNKLGITKAMTLAGVETFDDLIAMSDDELLDIRGIGAATLAKIRLEQNGRLFRKSMAEICSEQNGRLHRMSLKMRR